MDNKQPIDEMKRLNRISMLESLTDDSDLIEKILNETDDDFEIAGIYDSPEEMMRKILGSENGDSKKTNNNI